MEDEEYKKLPAEERCVHKLWKARVSAYEELTKTFKTLDDEKSPEFGKYLGLIKKFVIDSNAMGQEKGLETTLAYVEHYAQAGKTVSEVMSGIVSKCVAAPKTKTRELALQVTLMYIEIEKFEAVEDELIKGTEQKNPKIVAACIQYLTTALQEFGIKIITPKPILKRIGALFSDRDKTVRDETRGLVVELYKWMGLALKAHLQGANLQPVQLTELEAEFGKIEGVKVTPQRFIRSQQKKQAILAAQQENDDVDDEEVEETNEPIPIDPYDLADPVNILAKLPKDFYEKLEAKKWQDRKEVLEALENLLKTPKLENGEYGDVVLALKKVIQKDSNVVCVALAGRNVASLASGLKKQFTRYASNLISPLLEKFKEKKQNVVVAIREAIDATYLTTNFDTILDDVLAGLNNKNPSVKSETSQFLARAFTRTQPAAINKKLLKALTTALIKNMNESDPGVREATAEALGTLMKLVEEKSISQFLIDVDKLKMDKIREYFEKAELQIKVPVKKRVPVKEPPAPVAPKVVRPKKKGTVSSTSGITSTTSTKSAKPTKILKTEKELDDSEVEAIIEEILPNQLITDLANAQWKTRLAAAEELLNKIKTLDQIPAQALIRTLVKKPGLKDTNFQVLKLKFEVVKIIAETSNNFTITTVDICVADLTDKLGDAKNGTIVADTLTAIAEATSLSYLASAVLDAAFNAKSPKVQQEALVWLAAAVKEFGINGLDLKGTIERCKTALSSINPQVRQASIQMFGTLYLYMGNTVHVFLENEKPALKDQLTAEFEKYEGEAAPAPIRGKKSASNHSLASAASNDPPADIQDIIPRVDISTQFTESLLNQLTDKNWKERNEALIKVSQILQENKLIKPQLGDLPTALAPRLTDSNVKIAQAALNICQTIAKNMGPPSKQFIRTFFPGIVQNLGDTKSWMRTTALDTLNAFVEQGGTKEFFEGEMVAAALKSGSPMLRAELWTWLAEILPKIPQKGMPKEDLLACVPFLFSNLEDRSAEVRKAASEAVFGLMLHLGYDPMLKQTEKLKPGSKTTVITALEKARANLPIKPLPVKKLMVEEKVVKSGGGGGGKQTNTIVKKSTKPAAVTTSKKKDDDVDTSPLMVVNNLKHQRIIDETKLKVLKWNFTSPREEFVELLKDQMTTANINKTLISNMFHADFRFHIRAIESLMEDLYVHTEALIANLDLILKWFTLRFFDTNPSVLLKGLEYLQSVFTMLTSKKYQMLETEGSSFIPYLVLKIGDPKDAVRNGVKMLLKLIGGVYPVNRLAYYAMDGVKSKNARQRAECLEEMGSLIDGHGINVCYPTPAGCLKEVAKQISDRDNSVRSAALNCIVQAYNLIGDKVYKMVGNIADKDMSLLEERIKRASRKPMVVKPIDVPPPPMLVPQLNRMDNDDDEEEEDILPTLPSAVVPVEPAKQEVNGPFKLESVVMNDLDKITPHFDKLPIQKIDLEFLKEDVKMPSFFDNKAKIMPLSPPKPVALANKTFNLPYQPNDDPAIEKAINLIGSENLAMSLQGFVEFGGLMQNPIKVQNFSQHEEEFFKALVSLLRYLHTLDPTNNAGVARIYKDLFRSIDTFYQKPNLGKSVSMEQLKGLINELIQLLVEQKLEKCNESYTKVINIDCMKLIEQSDHTAVICALIRLMTESLIDEAPERHVELVMKCLWRVIKLLTSWGDDVDYEQVLVEIHHFLLKFPQKWWANRPIDTPLRTIKTILHSMAKLKGVQSIQLLAKIPNPAESEIESYILRLLKSLKIAETQDVPLMRNQMSRTHHAILTDIFQKIGRRDTNDEGLIKLYEFKQKYPEADLDAFLSRSTQFFQDYIKSGLKKIDSLKKEDNNLQMPISNNMDTQPDPNLTPEYFEERLSRWHRIWADLMEGKLVDHATWPTPPTAP